VGTVSLLNSTLSSNQALATGGEGESEGGGFYSGEGTIFLLNSTLSGNQAQATAEFGLAQGGGIFLNGFTMTLTNDTVANNVATSGPNGFGSGGGIASNSAGALQLKNTIVARNTATADGAPDLEAAFTSQGHNLIGNTTGTVGILDPTDETNVDPLLGPLANNGGPTQTLALLAGIPAIDAGSNALATDNNGVALPTDQRGFNRVVNRTVDIGAFEFQPPATNITLTDSPNPVAYGQPVLFTATVAGGTPDSNTPTGTVTFSDGGTPRQPSPSKVGSPVSAPPPSPRATTPSPPPTTPTSTTTPTAPRSPTG
jgi:hypothetical protein